MNIITVNHYYAGTGNIPPSFQSLDVVMADEAIEEVERLKEENERLRAALLSLSVEAREALR